MSLKNLAASKIKFFSFNQCEIWQGTPHGLKLKKLVFIFKYLPHLSNLISNIYGSGQLYQNPCYEELNINTQMFKKLLTL